MVGLYTGNRGRRFHSRTNARIVRGSAGVESRMIFPRMDQSLALDLIVRPRARMWNMHHIAVESPLLHG